MPCLSLQQISDLKHEIVKARSGNSRAFLALGEAAAILEKLENRITALSISVHIDDQQKL